MKHASRAVTWGGAGRRRTDLQLPLSSFWGSRSWQGVLFLRSSAPVFPDLSPGKSLVLGGAAAGASERLLVKSELTGSFPICIFCSLTSLSLAAALLQTSDLKIAGLMLSTALCQSALGQDTEPRTAPGGLMSALHGASA